MEIAGSVRGVGGGVPDERTNDHENGHDHEDEQTTTTTNTNNGNERKCGRYSSPRSRCADATIRLSASSRRLQEL